MPVSGMRYSRFELIVIRFLLYRGPDLSELLYVYTIDSDPKISVAVIENSILNF